MNQESGIKQTTEIKAVAREIHISPRKVRRVANLIKDLPLAAALEQLKFMTGKARRPLSKLLGSAAANASHNFQIEADRLFIKHLTVDTGRVMLRYQPRAQGRALPVRKRLSHINLVLGVRQQPFKVKAAKKQVVEEVKKPEIEERAKGEEREERGKASKWAFWRKKAKAEDKSQLPPKQDARGKHYTGFDRRGNM